MGKRRLGGSLVIAGKMVKINIEYIRVPSVLLPVEGGEQGQIMGSGVGICQKADITIL